MNSVVLALVRFGMSAAYRLHRLGRRIGFATREGAHAIAFTSARHVILVKLTYAPGWRLPGGGRRRGETGVEACLRELREEIGLIRHGKIFDLGRKTHCIDGKSHISNLIAIFDVEYVPKRWSIEIENIIDVDIERLPYDTAAFTKHAINNFEPVIDFHAN